MKCFFFVFFQLAHLLCEIFYFLVNFLQIGGANGAPMWKVLIYDSIGQSILAPIFSVKELREAGVTLHLALHSERYVFCQLLGFYSWFLFDVEKIHAKALVFSSIYVKNSMYVLYTLYFYSFIQTVFKL